MDDLRAHERRNDRDADELTPCPVGVFLAETRDHQFRSPTKAERRAKTRSFVFMPALRKVSRIGELLLRRSVSSREGGQFAPSASNSRSEAWVTVSLLTADFSLPGNLGIEVAWALRLKRASGAVVHYGKFEMRRACKAASLSNWRL